MGCFKFEMGRFKFQTGCFKFEIYDLKFNKKLVIIYYCGILSHKLDYLNYSCLHVEGLTTFRKRVGKHGFNGLY